MTAITSPLSRLALSGAPAALSAVAVGAAAQAGWLDAAGGFAGVLAASVAAGALAAGAWSFFRSDAADDEASSADNATTPGAVRRLRALEMSSTLTMLADRDLRIVYLNEALRRMLAEAQNDIRKDLPGFDADQLIGENIDVFHAKSEHQRKMIQALKRRHDAEISLGGRFFTLAVSPVRDEAGERVATVVEWRDVTVENRVQREIDAVVEAASVGEFGSRVSAEGATGLLADMAAKVNRLVETVDAGVGETRRVLGSVADGDLTQRMLGEFKGAFAELQESLNTAAENLQDAFVDITGASSELESGAVGIRDNAEKLASRTEVQATSLEQSSASLGQMATTIKANSENAVRATDLSNGVTRRAEERAAVVQEAVQAMTRIEQSSTQIADIIGVIDAIAFQTNLLALNAAVEAARAGESGRGFAIVAAEVRSLAQRSADAANDVRGLIENSSSHVSDGVRLVEQTGEALTEIVSSFREVSVAITEITEASRTQAAGIDGVSEAIREMDVTTQQNAEMADASLCASRGLETNALRLSSAMSRFQIGGVNGSPVVKPVGAQQSNTVAMSPPPKAVTQASRAPSSGRSAVAPEEAANDRNRKIGTKAAPVLAEADATASVANGSWAEF